MIDIQSYKKIYLHDILLLFHFQYIYTKYLPSNLQLYIINDIY